MTPVIVICRDRLSVLQELVAWLEEAGQERIVLVDVQTTYEPLREWLSTSPHVVERVDSNLGHRAPWMSGAVERHGGGRHPYVVTDCDVVPDENCPVDAVDHLVEQLAAHPTLRKVGLSLRIDDLPDDYPQVQAVRRWESRFNQLHLSPLLWDADVDTTFAAYRPGLDYDTHPGARTKVPYVARHMPWYATGELPEDESHYLANARMGDTTWNLDRVPDWLQRELDGVSPARVPGRVEAKIRHLIQTRSWR